MVQIRSLESTTVKQIGLKELVVAIELNFKTPEMPHFHRIVSCVGQLITMSCQSGRFKPSFSLALFQIPDSWGDAVDVETHLKYKDAELPFLRLPNIDLTPSLRKLQRKLPPSPKGLYWTPTEQEILKAVVEPLVALQDETTRKLPSGVCSKSWRLGP